MLFNEMKDHAHNFLIWGNIDKNNKDILTISPISIKLAQSIHSHFVKIEGLHAIQYRIVTFIIFLLWNKQKLGTKHS